MVAASADALGNAAAQAVISGSRRVDMTVSERLTEVAILCRDRITVVARDVPNEHRHTDGALRVYSALSAAAQALVDHVDSAGDPLFLAFAFAALGRAEEAAEVLGRHARSAAKGGPKGVHTPQIRLILEANPAASTAALRRAVPGADPSTIRRVKREFKRA